MSDILRLAPSLCWIPLLIIFLALKSSGRPKWLGWLTLVCVILFGYTIYMDLIWSRKVVAPIRVDLLILLPVLMGTGTGVGAWALRKAWRDRRGLLGFSGLMLLGLSLPSLFEFAQISFRSSIDSRKMQSIPMLLYRAWVQSPKQFEAYFGPLDEVQFRLAGSYVSGDPDHEFRWIVNSNGEHWILYPCADRVECVRYEGTFDPVENKIPEKLPLRQISLNQDWAQLLEDSHGLSLALFTEGQGVRKELLKSTRLRKEWPRWTEGEEGAQTPSATQAQLGSQAVLTAQALSAAQSVEALGAFHQILTSQNHSEIVQVWAWRQAEDYLLAYVRVSAQCGREQPFVFPVWMRARRGPAGIRFVSLMESAGGDELVMQDFEKEVWSGDIFFGGSPLKTIRLVRGEKIEARRFRIAPLIELSATSEWLRTVSLGYELHWKPDCSKP